MKRRSKPNIRRNIQPPRIYFFDLGLNIGGIDPQVPLEKEESYDVTFISQEPGTDAPVIPSVNFLILIKVISF